MIRNDLGLRGLTLLVSLLLHGLLFFHLGSRAGNSDVVPPERNVTHVNFRAVTTPQITPQPEVIEAVEPPPEPPPPKPQKRAERARQLDNAPQPVEEPIPPVVTSAEAQKEPVVAETAGTVADPALIEQARQEYLRRLMAHIDGHKQYPPAARRRGIEGEVRVAFALQPGGTINGLEVSGEHRLLSQAAEEAMAAALPLPSPPDGISLPWQLSFTMRFNLR